MHPVPIVEEILRTKERSVYVTSAFRFYCTLCSSCSTILSCIAAAIYSNMATAVFAAAEFPNSGEEHKRDKSMGLYFTKYPAFFFLLNLVLEIHILSYPV
jgi:ABC-type Co2+ transport system permease subunit